uniref:IS66 family transposase n=1 Tax=Anaeromyxobacter oryzisoli TaxID=2925408 RepID=UPI001F5820EB
GDIVAGWSRRWGRECFCKTLSADGGILLQNSRGRGPYLLQTHTLETRALPESGLGKAIAYMMGLWSGLTVFVDDPACRWTTTPPNEG